ncbi:cytochrome c oxidase assembly protein COX11, mitochondrial [Diorhabda carinulata]|uniref:cytochrome c oxidase assembly protein COX11, mitochondrial n=1 Tax=Diorhabda carinulata TaxID=1163345 RepID=UPI0025A145A1|nr:cytochrome c oxidase assembly protein COX11, mitochondrial [Diorhabda carinulata]
MNLLSNLVRNLTCRTNALSKNTINTNLIKRLCSNHNNNENRKRSIRSTLYYVTAAGIVTVGLSYAAVPLYRLFCQAYSYGGTVALGHDANKVENMSAVKNKLIKIKFNADTAASMRWNFKPQQTEIMVFPGETALAFYTAMNPTDKPVIGISTYNVVPFEAGQYFNKIQCFCFEEQMLNPHEQVDMPVFFYIDPEITEDPYMEFVNEITLSYTFFEAKEGLQLPLPTFVK